jgi:hypothetical protein
MAMSKPVVTLILSLQHELTSKGIRVQVVLPGGTATDGWDVAGFPWQKMPPEIGAPFANHPAWFLDPVVPLLIGFSVNPITLIPLIAIEGTLQETERNVRDSSRCADVFPLYFPNKMRRICSGSSSYNIGLVLGPHGVAQNIPSGRDDFSNLLWGMLIAILKTSSCYGSCWNPPCSELITRALLPSTS